MTPEQFILEQEKSWSETKHQIKLFSWIEEQKKILGPHWRELDELYHIPNGGKRDIKTASIMKRMGVKPGVPDLFLPVPSIAIYSMDIDGVEGAGYRSFCGMYIEMKSLQDNAKESSAQIGFMKRAFKRGYKCVTCKGWRSARAELIKYLEGR